MELKPVEQSIPRNENLHEDGFVFGTKAQTLERLAPRLTKAVVPKFFYFTVKSWQENRAEFISRVMDDFWAHNVIVRSSAFAEDCEKSTLAGFFDSVPSVKSTDRKAVYQAVEKVAAGYSGGSDALQHNHLIVQQMIENVLMSGVVFTQDLNTGAPYYVINYDDKTGRTDTVTSGEKDGNRTLFVLHGAQDDLRSLRFKALMQAVSEIEDVTGHKALDVEFAVSKDFEVYVFQVRKITTPRGFSKKKISQLSATVQKIRDSIECFFSPKANVFGQKSILGQMPDWNPAEMIGVAPRPLALSMYQKLITNNAWRVARGRMGYAEVVREPLLVSLAGQPMVDVRLSFNSFLPEKLSEQICHKLVDAWIARLSEHKELHDKIEFEIAQTVLTFNYADKLERFIPGVLSLAEKKEFRLALLRMTDKILAGEKGAISEQLAMVRQLDKDREELLNDPGKSAIEKIGILVGDCEVLGTIPFSILARHAFIARSFLLSLIEQEALTEKDAEIFQNSIKTVAGELVEALDQLGRGEISRSTFLKQYGHLRPGTYDILSLRYDQRRNFLSPGLTASSPKSIRSARFVLTEEQSLKIAGLLKKSGLSINVEQLFVYMRKAIAGREYAKFVFTKNISDSLELIKYWGEEVGLSREDLSFLKIEEILDSGPGFKANLAKIITSRNEQYEVTKALKIPHLIISPEDVFIVPLYYHRPNFITHKRVRGRSLSLDGHEIPGNKIAGTIVLIEGADPGFDWIFSYPILGLITKYGGANSHMAIRCAEFGLPAAIGCGEQIFDRMLRSNGVELNCSEGWLVPIEV